MNHNQTYRWSAFGIAVGITALAVLLLAVGADAASNQSGNRIWDESKNLSTNYTWNAYSFSGFYYNLDDNLSTEELSINNINPVTRVIAQGDMTYKTSPIEVNFVYSPFGSYQVIGFMADKYFAGYTANSTISKNRKISTIGSGQLQKVLLDDEDKRVVTEGGTLTLNEGYVLKAKEVDIGGGPRQVWVSLIKDGTEVDSSVVAAGDTYFYIKKVGSVSDLPIIAIHVDSVFRGTEANAAFIKGVFQISDSYTKVSSGDRYGVMEITGAGTDQITMDNRDSVDQSPANTADLMGNLKLIVADNSSVLRFALSVERTGTFDVRGTIYPVTNEWTPQNFGLNIGSTSIGFFYDMDKDIGTEKLTINPSGASIPEGGLVYSTSPQEIGFDYSGFGSYQVIGFMADKYFAGYTANTKPPNPTTRISGTSTLAQGQLQKVLIDDETQRVITVGGTLTLKEGYVLKAKDIDLNARTMLLSLLKDGNEVDSTPLSAGQTYVYSKKVGAVSDLPIIIARFDSVFSGAEVQAAFIKGVFQISEDITSVKSGDTYGQMRVGSISAGGIEMDNPNSVGISPASTVDLMGNIKLMVADSSEVRFYPFVAVVPEMLANQLVIDAPAKATAGDAIKIMVTAGGAAIEGASVAIDSGIGQTDITGTLNYTLPKTLNGTYNITATKLGYQKATKTIDVAGFIQNMLSIDAPAKADQFGTITIKVTFNGAPVSGASITYDNASIGQTDSSGTLNYTLGTGGTHTISASKSGYITAARDIEVRLPFSDFRALDINITPPVVSTGGTAVIRSNITNAGTKKDTLPVVLIVNSTEVDNRSVTLAPGEVKEVNFTYKVTLPEGNYSVEILGQKALLEVVKKMPADGVLIGTGVIVLVYLMVAKRPKNKKL
jgi:S-layer protein (TIGR01567 family)